MNSHRNSEIGRTKRINILMMGKMPLTCSITDPKSSDYECFFTILNIFYFLNKIIL